MPDRLTQSQVEQLGRRLVAADRPEPADLELLQQVLTRHDRVLSLAVDRVRPIVGSAPTSRIKNTGTILEKLERQGGSWLKSLHDIAGMRIVQDFGRAEQDELAAALADEFAGEQRAPRIIDRRAQPVQGYRAVHVIVFPERTPVEIQVRTQLQHEWAEIFEKLADLLGRGIRYGEPPGPLPASATTSLDPIKVMLDYSEVIDNFEQLDPRLVPEPYDRARETLFNFISVLRAYVESLDPVGPTQAE